MEPCIDSRGCTAYNEAMEWKVIHTAQQMAPHLPGLLAARVLAVDLETGGLDPHRHPIRLVQLAAEGMPVLVVNLRAYLPEGLPQLHEILATKAVKVFQNAKFDLQFLLPLGIYPKPVFDTMLAGRLLYMPGKPRRVNLRALAAEYLGEDLDKGLQTSDWDGPLTESQIEYAARDAHILLRLRQRMIPQMVAAGLVKVAEIEFACVRAMAQLEYHGIALDVPRWQALTAQVEAEREAAVEMLSPYTGKPLAQTTLWGKDEIYGFNLDSNAYVMELLSKNGIQVPSTSKGELYPYRDHPLVKGLLRYRKAAKALSAVLLPMPGMVHPVTGRLHPHYEQIGAYSGRMSCYNPNIQQIPRGREFRACFVAPQGRCLVIADYAQIELRVTAQMTQDERMLAAYRKGEDLHCLTASLLLDKPTDAVTKQDRQAAKAVNFGLIYGMGANGLQGYAQQSYGVEMSHAQAELFRERFFRAYREVARWHRSLKEKPPQEGRTLTGRRFPISSTPSLPELSNSPVQGTAADIVKKALGMLAGHTEGTDIRMAAVVHDEIVLECSQEDGPQVAEMLRAVMEEAQEAVLPSVPGEAEAKVADSWAEK